MPLEIEEIHIGNKVVCDICDKDFTDSNVTGGILFCSNAVCPECAPRIEALAKKFDEEEHIKARCPDGMKFRD